jgi:MoxR-like ATPase
VDLKEFSRIYAGIEAESRRAFLGQEDVLSGVLVAIYARGHVLIEGVPGVGKTLLVRVLGKVLGCHFRRIQFTPDLMPSDVTGSTVFNAQANSFEFKHGPVFTHVLLADEVNRAPAKTQSSMLEAMQERSVTVDGITYPLPNPFFVLATQNPIESAGTYALPEAQLDRFLFKVLIDHPPLDVEERILRNVRDGFDAADLEAMKLCTMASPEAVVEMQKAVQTVHVDDQILHYVASLVAATRKHRAVQIGASPRASIALLQTARVEAAIQGRDFVVPDDVKTHGRAVLRHRLILQPDAEIEGVSSDEVIEQVLGETKVPGMGESGRPSRRTPGAGNSPLAEAPLSSAPRFSQSPAPVSGPGGSAATAPSAAFSAAAPPAASASGLSRPAVPPAPSPTAASASVASGLVRSPAAPAGLAPVRPAAPAVPFAASSPAVSAVPRAPAAPLPSAAGSTSGVPAVLSRVRPSEPAPSAPALPSRMPTGSGPARPATVPGEEAPRASAPPPLPSRGGDGPDSGG